MNFDRSNFRKSDLISIRAFGVSVVRRRVLSPLIALTIAASGAYAGTAVGLGAGGNLPPGAPAVASGTFTSNALFSTGGTVASGNAVTVILKGLQHDWSGDLIATLSYLDSNGKTVASANLFYRIGQTTSQPDGAWAGFGAPGPTGDNYIFNSGAPGNIWSVAGALGFADSIPGQQTDTVSGGQYFTTDAGGATNNLSYAFAGLSIAGGTWRLTITDASDHASQGGTLSNIGSLIGWEIDIQTSTAATPDFTVGVTPPSQSVTAGTSANYSVTIVPVNGFSGSTSLSATGLPSGTSSAFSPNPVLVSGATAVSTLTISTLSSVAPGSYPFTVTGVSGSLVHSTAATLTITAQLSAFPAGTVPPNYYADPNAVELGVKIRSDVAGYITGVRFYKNSVDTSVHTGSLWSSTGQLLATGTFTGESASGWQQLNFAAPVEIAANTTYVASYHTSSGFYSSNYYFASQGVNNGTLHELQAGADGPDGVYDYGSGGVFPTHTWESSNYWVDVVFSQSTTTPSNVFSPGTTPPSYYSDPNPVELAVKIRSDIAGYITGVRFYKNSADTSVHTGSLWSDSGQLLATGTFGNESASGWQQLNFSTPVAITANTTYVASYHTSSGFYSSKYYFANQGANNGTLHALQDGVDGPDGVFYYGSGGVFPSQSWESSNYWVDVVFSQTASKTPPATNIFASGTTPPSYYSDPNAVELAVKFRSDVAGHLTGVRFYKNPADTSVHTGSLWSDSGQLLATGTFTNETASGWQQLNFSTPVAIAANTTYLASYHTSSGFYSSNYYFANQGANNGTLHALEAGVDGPDGVFYYSSGGVFPTQTWESSNYWVDIVFTTP